MKRHDFLKALLRRNYAAFLEYAYHGRYIHAQHTRLICEKLNGILTEGSKRIMIFMPPRHSKSMTVTESFPSYYLMRNPNKRVIITAYGDSLAQQFGIANRKIFAEFAPDLFGLRLSREKATNTNWNISGHPGGLLSTTIMGGATGHGADLLIIDDPLKNRQEANSKTHRDRLLNEYQSTFRTRLQGRGSIVLIMTRWHKQDLAGQLLAEKREDWDVISLPAICEDEGPDLLGRELGDPLWPENNFNLDWAVKTQLDVGSYVWGSMFQQRPTEQAGSLFKRDLWRYYTKPPSLRSFQNIIMSVDCAFKDVDTSDFTVIQVWGYIRGGEFYLLDQARARMGLNATVNTIRNMSHKWPDTHFKLVEEAANGAAVIEMLNNEIRGLEPIHPKNSKETRAQAVTPLVERRVVFIPDPSIAPWIHEFVEECAEFPKGAFDDSVDAMTQALQYLRSRNKHDFMHWREDWG